MYQGRRDWGVPPRWVLICAQGKRFFSECLGVTGLAVKAGQERGEAVLGVEGMSRKKALLSGTAY